MIFVRSSALPFIALAIAASQAQTAKHGSITQPKTDLFEDDQVRIPIPAGWKRTDHFSPLAHNSFHGSDNGKPRDFPITGTLLLERDGYTLTLAYDTQQASGVIGGRIIEIFDIPWSTEPNGDEWSCEESFTRVPQPATRALFFQNLVVDSDKENVRNACNIPVLSPKPPQTTYGGAQRWFGGYFTTDGGYFFNQRCGQGTCRELAYTLTGSAKTVDQLPTPEDAHLAEVVQQAIHIVDSIEYKKFKLKPISPFRVNLPE